MWAFNSFYINNLHHFFSVKMAPAAECPPAPRVIPAIKNCKKKRSLTNSHINKNMFTSLDTIVWLT